MIKIIKRYFPKSLKMKLINNKLYILTQLNYNYLIDLITFAKYSGTFNSEKTQLHHEASLIFYYHKIEKGLSLPNPRVGFGKENVYHLVSLLEDYFKKYGWDEVSKVTLNTLYSYYYFNEKNGKKIDDIYNRIDRLNKTVPQDLKIQIGGVNQLDKRDIVKDFVDFKDFAYSRYSIRNFSPEEVSLDLIKDAVEIAQKTPSVCNRQTSRVIVFDDEKLKKEVLKYQNGNGGFGQNASKILIVTTQMESFIGAHERNQGYIDGGMYAMSLIYALHSLGVGTCPLNLALNINVDKKLKRAAKINNSEILIMMIAVGNLPEKLKVASSHRRDASEVMTIY